MKIRILTLALVLMSTWSWSQTNGGELSGRAASGIRKAVGVDSTAPNRAALRVKDSTLIATLTDKDSTTMSRKNVQVTNEVTTKMSTVDSTSLDLLATTLSDINGQMFVLSDNSFLYDENNHTRLGHIDTMTMNIKDSLSLIRSQLRSELVTINNSTVTALGYQDDLPMMRDTIGKIYNKMPSNLTVTSTRLLVDGSGVTQPVSGTVAVSGHDSTSDSRKGVVLLVNPTITNDSTTMSRTTVKISSMPAVTVDSTSASRKGVVLLANPTIANDSTTMSRKNVQVTNTVTVGSHAVTNAGTFAVQVDGNALTSLQLADDVVYTDGSGTVTKGTAILGQDGTNPQAIKTDATGELQVDVLTMPTVTVNTHAVTQSGTWTLGANSGVDIGDVTINNAAGASAVNIQDGGNTITVDGTVAVSGHDSTTDSRKGVVLLTTPSVQGTAANDAALSGNPVNIGAKGITAEPTAITADRQVQLVADVVGKLITSPYANTDLFVSGSTSAITDTTSTSVIAAAGSGVRNYITSILVTNSHATVSTFVKILDGTTTLWQGYALAAGGGFSVTFPVPLRGTANTAINAKCVTTGANVVVNCAGYKGR